MKTSKDDHKFKDIYLFKKDIKIKDLKFKDGEVVSARWVDIANFMHMFNNGEIVYNVDFDDKDYAKCLSLLNL